MLDPEFERLINKANEEAEAIWKIDSMKVVARQYLMLKGLGMVEDLVPGLMSAAFVAGREIGRLEVMVEGLDDAG